MSFVSMRNLRSLVTGRNVLIVGSGPSRSIPPDVSFDVVAFVNGSGSLREFFEFAPQQLFFLNEEMRIRGGPNPQRDVASDLVHLKVDDHVFFLRTNLSWIRKVSIWWKRDPESETGFRSFQDQITNTVSLGDSRRILTKLTGSKAVGSWPNGLPSTGFLAIAVTLFCKPRELWVTGFSVSPLSSTDWGGHFYDDEHEMEQLDPGQLRPRDHAVQDALLLSSLTVSGRVVNSSDEDLRFLTGLFHDPNAGDQVNKPNALLRYIYSKWSIF